MQDFDSDGCQAARPDAMLLQAVGLFFTPESPVWLEWKGRKAAAMYNQHKLLGSHWQEEGEVGDPEQEASQPLNGDADDQVITILHDSSAAVHLYP